MLLKKQQQKSKEVKLKHTAPKITSYIQAKQNTAKHYQDSSHQKELCKYVARMLTVDMWHIYMVEDVGLKAFVLNLDSRFDLPSRRSFTRRIMSDFYRMNVRSFLTFLKGTSIFF